MDIVNDITDMPMIISNSFFNKSLKYHNLTNAMLFLSRAVINCYVKISLLLILFLKLEGKTLGLVSVHERW